MIEFTWTQIQTLNSKKYVCGYCGTAIASDKGYSAKHNILGQMVYIYICHRCEKPTFFDLKGNQWPGVTFGNKVNGIPDSSIEMLYEEARKATGAGCFTAAVLCCRKLLMHIAVSKGAEEGKSFVYYVQYLADNHYIPPDAVGWVDHIRTKGNEANHEISIMPKEDAEDLLSFIEMLLKVIYEFPSAIKNKKK